MCLFWPSVSWVPGSSRIPVMSLPFTSSVTGKYFTWRKPSKIWDSRIRCKYHCLQINLGHIIMSAFASFLLQLIITSWKLTKFINWYWHFHLRKLPGDKLENYWLTWMHHLPFFVCFSLWAWLSILAHSHIEKIQLINTAHVSFFWTLSFLSVKSSHPPPEAFSQHVCTGDWDELESVDLFLLFSHYPSFPF